MSVVLPDPFVGGPIASDLSLQERFDAIQRNFDALKLTFPLGAEQFQDGSVGAAAIADASITGTEIGSATITGTNIAAATITGSNIAAATISGSNIAAATIAGSNIANATITAAQIANATITGSQIASATITGGNIASATITGGNVASATITGGNIDALTIVAGNIANSTITAGKMSIAQLDALSANMGTLTTGKVLIGTAGGAKVAIGTSISTSAGSKDGIVGADSSNAITFWIDPTTGNLQLKGTILSGSSGLGNISGTVDGSQIGSGVVTGTHIAADTIVAGNIAASAIGTSELAAGAVTASKITAGTITSTELSATAIDAMTITGATIRTASSGARIELTSTDLAKYDASSNKTVRITPADGLDLLSGTSATPPNDRMLRWLSGTDVVTKLASYVVGGAYATNLYGIGASTGTGQVNLEASRTADSSDFARFNLQAAAAASDITAWVSTGGGGNLSKLLLNDTAASDWMLATGEHVRVGRSATQAIGNATTADMTWDQENWDVTSDGSNDQHDNVTNSARLTCRRAGVYLATFWSSASAAGGLGWNVLIRKYNSGGVLQENVANAGAAGELEISITGLVALAAGDYIVATVTNNTGASRNFTGRFGMSRIGAV